MTLKYICKLFKQLRVWVFVKILTLVTFMFFANALLAQPSVDQHRWNERVLVLRASSATDSMVIRQQEELARGRDGLRERKVVTYIMLPGKFSYENGPFQVDNALTAKYSDNQEAFALVLIGLDGTVKARYSLPVTCEALFARIDSMPMRRAEMRDRN